MCFHEWVTVVGTWDSIPLGTLGRAVQNTLQTCPRRLVLGFWSSFAGPALVGVTEWQRLPGALWTRSAQETPVRGAERGAQRWVRGTGLSWTGPFTLLAGLKLSVPWASLCPSRSLWHYLLPPSTQDLEVGVSALLAPLSWL